MARPLIHQDHLEEMIKLHGHDAGNVDLDALSDFLPNLPQDLPDVFSETLDWVAVGDPDPSALSETYSRAERNRKGRPATRHRGRPAAPRRMEAGRAPPGRTAPLPLAQCAPAAHRPPSHMNHLPTLPLLEALRPPPGMRTDRAMLSAYSAEPRVLVSLLFALAGRDDDSGSGRRGPAVHVPHPGSGHPP